MTARHDFDEGAEFEPLLEPPTAPHEQTAPRLRRSRTDKVLGGVAGGLGRYLGVDPVILRLAFVALAFTGAGVLAYIVAWIVIPEERPGELPETHAPANMQTARMIIGGVLIAAGMLFLIERVAPWFDWRVMWSLVLVAIGAAIVLQGARR